MRSLEAYESLLIKVNRNDSNSNIHVPRGKFVVIYNEQKNKWLDEKLDNKLKNMELDDVSELLIPDVELEKLKDHKRYTSFKLPSDFFATSSSYSLASKGTCTNRPIINWEIKSRDLHVLLPDSNYAPSFEYEETLMLITRGEVQIYRSDFQIDEAFLSYYREPGKIDIAGYTKLDGSPSKDIDPDLSDMLVNEIISRCALEIMTNNQNAEGFQFAQSRTQRER